MIRFIELYQFDINKTSTTTNVKRNKYSLIVTLRSGEACVSKKWHQAHIVTTICIFYYYYCYFRNGMEFVRIDKIRVSFYCIHN